MNRENRRHQTLCPQTGKNLVEVVLSNQQLLVRSCLVRNVPRWWIILKRPLSIPELSQSLVTDQGAGKQIDYESLTRDDLDCPICIDLVSQLLLIVQCSLKLEFLSTNINRCFEIGHRTSKTEMRSFTMSRMLWKTSGVVFSKVSQMQALDWRKVRYQKYFVRISSHLG